MNTNCSTSSTKRNIVFLVLFLAVAFFIGDLMWLLFDPDHYDGIWGRQEATLATVAAATPQTSYKVMVTVNDVRVFSQKIEGEEVEFLFILNLSYYDVAVCHEGDRCVSQVDTALDGYWPETLDYLGPFPYRDGRWDKVNVVVKSWWSDAWYDNGECVRTDTDIVEYKCVPGALLKYTIDYDASRHSWEEGGKTVVSINQPYLSVTVKP